MFTHVHPRSHYNSSVYHYVVLSIEYDKDMASVKKEEVLFYFCWRHTVKFLILILFVVYFYLFILYAFIYFCLYLYT